MPASGKPATAHTVAANARVAQSLPFHDVRDFEEADRGFIAPLPDNGVIANEQGRPVWDLTRFNFLQEDIPAPDTVNPSLWRQARLVVKAGLYKVTDRLYQVRTADLANITFIEGDTGLIVADTAISAETARAALELYYAHRPRKPVVVVIHSHSHVDHFGGVKGIVDEADVRAGRVRIFAPAGFTEAVLAENVLAGTVMSRRGSYMYGNLLPPGANGNVGTGLGVSTSNGTITLIQPTDLISEKWQTVHLDGLDFEFLLTPDTEAPAEMHWYIPQLKALTAAENVSHNLHNTYTLRGALARDVQAWSKAINDTIDRWGDQADVLYGMHHWPSWGRERIHEMLTIARDGYRYLHDQTLRLANHGFTPTEISEQLEFPPAIDQHWSLRPYYGTISHNVKGIYTRYLGWFDANPANLNLLPPEESAGRYVALMGGVDAVVAAGQAAFDAGEYRWVAELLKHVVFADPAHTSGRELLADAFEQLGYQAESGPWRNFYLSGAAELRNDVPNRSAPNAASPDVVRAMHIGTFLDFLAVRLNGPRAVGKSAIINFNFTDTGEQVVAILSNAALSHSLGRQDPNADATVTLTRAALNEVMVGATTFADAIAGGAVQVSGDPGKLVELMELMDTFDFWFNISEP